MRTMLFYRSKARAELARMRGGMNRRYSPKRTVRAGAVAGAGLVTVAGMNYPALEVSGAAGASVDVYNAGRPAAATYAPAYGAAGGTGASSTANVRITSSDSTARTLLALDDLIGFDTGAFAAVLAQDGDGSGLDADLLDGEHADAFVLLAGRLGDVIALLTTSAPAAAVDAVKLHANDQQGRAGDHALHITPEATGRGYSFGTQAQLGGGLALPIASKTADYTATLADHTILIDASAGNVTVSLPAAATTHNPANGVGHIYRIKRIDASGNAATIDADGAEIIDGAAIHTLAAQYDAIAIQSDGSAWHIIGRA